MARAGMRATLRINWTAIGWMALGALLMALWILGPRVALNRGLDAGYTLADWASSFFSSD